MVTLWEFCRMKISNRISTIAALTRPTQTPPVRVRRTGLAVAGSSAGAVSRPRPSPPAAAGGGGGIGVGGTGVGGTENCSSNDMVNGNSPLRQPVAERAVRLHMATSFNPIGTVREQEDDQLVTSRSAIANQPLVAWAAWSLSLLLLTTGTWHFASPNGFESVVPGFLGSPAFWVKASGLAELACAVSLAFRSTRRMAGWACALLFVVVYPANIKMALDSLDGHGSVLIAWLRLPLQIPLVLWACYIARRSPRFDG